MRTLFDRSSSGRTAGEARDRFLAWLVTGPAGRVAGFFCELAIGLWSMARSRLRRRG